MSALWITIEIKLILDWDKFDWSHPRITFNPSISSDHCIFLLNREPKKSFLVEKFISDKIIQKKPYFPCVFSNVYECFWMFPNRWLSRWFLELFLEANSSHINADQCFTCHPFTISNINTKHALVSLTVNNCKYLYWS